MQQDQPRPITITVTNPQHKSATVNKFVTYTLKGQDKHGHIEVVRRYSEFDLLRETLVKRWPGFYIPSLPQKKTIGSNEVVFIQSRRRLLQQFLVTLSLMPSIWYEQQSQLFLRNNTSQTDKIPSSLSKQPIQRVVQRYTKLFPALQAIQLTNAMQFTILEFGNYLRDSKMVVRRLQEMAEKMTGVNRKKYEKMMNVMQFLLPEYQRCCLLANDQKHKQDNFIFHCSKTNGIAYNIQKCKKMLDYPAVLIIHEYIKKQRRQIQAFQLVIVIRNQYQAGKQKALWKLKNLEAYQSKINSGKQSILSKSKSQSKQSQKSDNQEALERAREQKKNYCSMCNFINALLSTVQIDRFKQIRQKSYYKLLKNVATCENQLAKIQNQLWQCVGKHDMIGLQNSQQVFESLKKSHEYYKSDKNTIKEEEHAQIKQKNGGEESFPL